MNIHVSCDEHNVSMESVREYPSGSGIEVTVRVCPECIEEATKLTEAVLKEFVIYLGGFGLSDEQIESIENFLTERLRPAANR